MLDDSTQQQKAIKDNFLNLLCALSGVILCAECRAIVVLLHNFNVAFLLHFQI